MSFDPRLPSTLGLPSKLERKIRGLVRRMIARATSGGLWALQGYDDEPDDEVPLFSGIGFFSRPAAGSEPEVIVVKVGAAAGHPVIVATRDEETRVDLEEDETAIYTSQSIVKIKADGTIEVGSVGGTFVPLALKSDVQEVIDAISDAAVLANDGGATLIASFDAAIAASSTPTGTTKLKAE